VSACVIEGQRPAQIVCSDCGKPRKVARIGLVPVRCKSCNASALARYRRGQFRLVAVALEAA
jgi:ribosomal protein L37AE/L43A